MILVVVVNVPCPTGTVESISVKCTGEASVGGVWEGCVDVVLFFYFSFLQLRSVKLRAYGLIRCSVFVL